MADVVHPLTVCHYHKTALYKRKITLSLLTIELEIVKLMRVRVNDGNLVDFEKSRNVIGISW